MDLQTIRMIAAVVAVIAFNAPIAVSALGLKKVQNFSGVLQEKDANGASTGAVSYSRVAGIVGATVVGSLFWVISNIVIATAIVSPAEVPNILSGISTLFLVGTALFLPYGFNQLKAVLQ